MCSKCVVSDKYEKEYFKAAYCHPVYLTYMQSTSEKAKAPHFSNLAWKIPWTEEPGGLQPIGLQKSRTQLSNQTTTEKHESGIMADFLVIIFKTVIK